MVTANEIGWGKYRQYSGPFYRGKFGYVLPSNPRPEDMQMAVITATEGGHYDAWNGYDVCGWTSGLIQWCERGQYSVSDMLGAVYEEVGADAIAAVEAFAKDCGLKFDLNKKGRYRFHFLDARGEVDSQKEQQQLFYVNGDGTQGSWTETTKLYAKHWAALISSVWENPEAQAVQVEYTAKRLTGFLLPFAKSVFAPMPQTDIARGLYAAYLSFAANNPTWANKSLTNATSTTLATPWTQGWAIDILKELTFGPGVAIYPHRYNAIRPVLEKLYGMNLPDFDTELKAWSTRTGIPAGITTVRLQRALLSLGYDLGPKGADGIYGKKTTEAVLTLEQLSGIVPQNNQDGQVDEHTWPALTKALADKGLSMPA